MMRTLIWIALSACLSTVALAQISRSTRELESRAEKAFQAQEWNQSEQLYRALVTADPDHGLGWYRLGYSLHVVGRLEEALKADTRAARYPEVAVNAMYNAACANALLSRPDEAFSWLDRAVRSGFADAAQLKEDADFKSIRDDARWPRLVARVGTNPPGTRFPPPKAPPTKTVPKDRWPPVEQPAERVPYDAALNRPRPSSREFMRLPQSRAFEFLAKQWAIRNTFYDSGRGRWRSSAATMDVRSYFGGKSSIDHYAGETPDGERVRGMSIRDFDAETGEWSTVWLDDRRPLSLQPMVGSFDRGIGTFYPQGQTAETATQRFRWDGISSRGARWMLQSRTSNERGRDWVATWVMEFSSPGPDAEFPAEEPPPSAKRPRPGRGVDVGTLQLHSTYLSDPVMLRGAVAYRIRLGIDGLSGAAPTGRLELDPNTCTVDAFGDPGACTEMAAISVPVKLRRVAAKDVRGAGRRLYDVAGVGGSQQLRLVLGTNPTDQARLLVLDAGAVIQVVPLGVTAGKSSRRKSR